MPAVLRSARWLLRLWTRETQRDQGLPGAERGKDGQDRRGSCRFHWYVRRFFSLSLFTQVQQSPSLPLFFSPFAIAWELSVVDPVSVPALESWALTLAVHFSVASRERSNGERFPDASVERQGRLGYGVVVLGVRGPRNSSYGRVPLQTEREFVANLI